MAEATGKPRWAYRATWIALALSVGGAVAALIAAIGSGQGAWPFGTGFTMLRYAFYAAAAGGVVALVASIMARRTGAKTGMLNLIAAVVALGFVGYLGRQVMTATSVPAIHDATTNLDDVPQFATLSVRADNLEKVPDMDRAELAALAPEARWKAIHREAYGDLKTVRMPGSVADTVARAQRVATGQGWTIARADPAAGIVEATATTLFFRFKDDVVVRVRPAPGGGSLVDMRSISRVGGSDVGVNAERIRSFMRDLQAA